MVMNYLEKAFETVVPSTGENTCTVVTFVISAINVDHVDTFQSFSQARSSGYDYHNDHDDNGHDDLDAPLKVAGLMEPDGQREAKAAIVFSSTNVLLKDYCCVLWYTLNCYVSRYFKL